MHDKRFLNFKKVLCISPHPDDVEIAMMGTIVKYSGTHFDILCLTKGGAKGYDNTNLSDRRAEVKAAWKKSGCSNMTLYNSKYEYFEDTSESGWINHIENDFLRKDEYDCIFLPTSEDSMFEHRFVSKMGPALNRSSLISLIEYHIISSLNTWHPNLFVNISEEYSTKINSLKEFKSQLNKTYFSKNVLDSFHSNFQCSKKGLPLVEKYRIIEFFGGLE